MKETIAEYSRVIIVCVCFAALCLFIFSGIWFNMIGNTMLPVENQVKEDNYLAVQEILEDRKELPEKPVVLVAVGDSYLVGSTIMLKELVQETSINKDMGETLRIICTDPNYNEEKGTLLLANPGIYKVTYIAQDQYGQRTTKEISIIAK